MHEVLCFAGQKVSRKMDGKGLRFADVLARSSIVFCNSVFADRTVMAASRLLGATAACVILCVLQLDIVRLAV